MVVCALAAYIFSLYLKYFLEIGPQFPNNLEGMADKFLRMIFPLAVFFILIYGAFFVSPSFFITNGISKLQELEESIGNTEKKITALEIELQDAPLKVAALNNDISDVRKKYEDAKQIMDLELVKIVETYEETWREHVTNSKAQLESLLSEGVSSATSEYNLLLDTAIQVQSDLSKRLTQIEELLNVTTNSAEKESLVKQKGSVIASLENAKTQSPIDLAKIRNEIKEKFELDQKEIREMHDAKLVGEQAEARKIVAELEGQLEQLEMESDSAEGAPKKLNTEIATQKDLLENSKRRLEILDENLKPQIERVSSFLYLTFRALFLGALGAFASLLIRTSGAERVNDLVTSDNYYLIIILDVLVGAIVAVAGLALMYTNIFSVFTYESSNITAVPDQMKVTLLCIGLGAFSGQIFELLSSRIKKLEKDIEKVNNDKLNNSTAE